MVNPWHECTLLSASSCQNFFYVFNYNSVMLGYKMVFRKNITTQWGCHLNPFHHMLYEIGKTTLQNSDFIKIWNVIQIWISFQNQLVRQNSAMTWTSFEIKSVRFDLDFEITIFHCSISQIPFCQVQQAGKATGTIVNDNYTCTLSSRDWILERFRVESDLNFWAKGSVNHFRFESDIYCWISEILIFLGGCI